MPVLLYSIIANLIISLGSLLGVVTLTVNRKKLEQALLLLVALSAGAMLGNTLFHLLPEANALLPWPVVSWVVFLAFSLFFLLEKFFRWRHCHHGRCREHQTFGSLNLVGDGIHNFIDGLIISGAFLADFRLGLATAAAIALHEIPQEIGDFGVLIYSGFSKTRALLLNLLVGLAAVIGGVAGYFLAIYSQALVSYLIPFAAGGFLYIGASDLLPEIKKEADLKKSLLSFAVFLAGVWLMFLVK